MRDNDGDIMSKSVMSEFVISFNTAGIRRVDVLVLAKKPRSPRQIVERLSATRTYVPKTDIGCLARGVLYCTPNNMFKRLRRNKKMV